MEVTHDKDNIPLTAGELAELFTTYLSNSASICVLSYFVEKAEDPDIKSVIKMALDASNKAVKQIADIFANVNHPIPLGFSQADVNTNAQKLYSDKFMIIYVRFLARFGLTNYSEARSIATRSDVRDFFNEFIHSTLELLNVCDNVLLNKGLYEKEPYIPIPDKVDFVEKQSFLSGFLGERRPLNASEINRLYLNFVRSSLGKAFLLGLCQTITDKEIKEYFLRGMNISQTHMEVVDTFLKKDDLPTPVSLDSEITASTVPIFSDKLMMFHVVSLNGLGLGINGISLSRVMRRDLSLALTRFMTEIALFAEDGFNILIDRKWFERMPQAADRKELLNI